MIYATTVTILCLLFFLVSYGVAKLIGEDCGCFSARKGSVELDDEVLGIAALGALFFPATFALVAIIFIAIGANLIFEKEEQ